ncbi:MAG TPA: DUF2235 domain-containing protein [Bauldia sp.]|nr:DUF2235 domain-containing protein [Bauldia sp.]
MIQPRLPKRLIVCLDGTWNDARGATQVTNVVRIRDALVSGADTNGDIQQRIYYDEGVGTGDGPIDKVFGGAFGSGLSRNIRQAYKYLCRHYNPGDDIHIIGFSRGSFTARSLAGMIGVCGLLRKESCTTENEHLVWSYYHTDRKDRSPGDESKWRDVSYSDVPIRSVAVFDTVGSLGIPDRYLNQILHSRFAFHDTRIGTAIKNAFHAIAIDERRRPFSPTLWERPFNTPKYGNVQQVWFPGVHADVGGGYPEAALSSIALDWIVKKLKSVGVEFEEEELKSAGLGSVRDAPAGTIHESRSWLYLADRMRLYFRRITRDGGFEAARGDDEQLRYDPLDESIHCSALERAVRVPEYRPLNLGAVLHLIEKGCLGVIDWDGGPLKPEDAKGRLEAISDWKAWSSHARRMAFASPSPLW